MALQIWLPLDGDFNNYGISKDLSFTISGTITDIDGKIGKAKHFATGMAKAPLTYTIGNEISFSYWVYYDSFRSDNEWIFEIGNTASGYNNALLGIASTPTKLVCCLGGTNNNTTTHGFIVNTWYHITFTWDGTTAKIYKDGELLKSFAMAKGSITSGTNISIGSNVANSNTKISGRLNDIRIYNHCLSIKEVKELAKGLVLHYKLSKPLHTNLLAIKPKSHNATAYNAYQLNLLENLQGEQTYTLQLWDVDVAHSGKTASQLNVAVYWGGGSISLFQWGATNFTNGHANYLVKTFTPTAANASHANAVNTWLNIYNSVSNASGTRNLTIGAWKLEKGSVATPFDIGVNDPAYVVAGYNENIEPDCSGYKRDGTMVGTINGNTDTPRYRTCDNITNNSSYIKVENLTTIGFGNSYSFSWWAKVSNYNNMHWGFSNGIRLNGMYTGKLWNTGDGSNNPIYQPGTTTQITIPTANVWHHFVMTGDGTSSKLYVDGEHYGTAKTYKGISGTTLIINGWDTGTSYSGQINISDFRIYATALSADDIKALYENVGYIDNGGNFHVYEYSEF